MWHRGSFILFYFILFHFISFYFILFYFILSYIILFYFILFYFILFYFILFYFNSFYFISFYSIYFFYLENACGGLKCINRTSKPSSAELFVPLSCDLALLRGMYAIWGEYPSQKSLLITRRFSSLSRDVCVSGAGPNKPFCLLAKIH